MMSSNLQETMLWKEEPLSPIGTSLSDSGEEWLLFDEKPVVLGANGEEFTFYDDEQLTRAEVVTKFLEKLDSDNWIKEESFPVSWLDEKIEDLPIFDGLPAPECGQNRANLYPALSKPQPAAIVQVAVDAHQNQPGAAALASLHHHHHLAPPQHHQAAAVVDPTQSLLREFETVLGDVEACHQIIGHVSTLTPPQSPPPKVQQQLLVTLQPLYQAGAAAGAFFFDQPHQQQSIAEAIPAETLNEQPTHRQNDEAVAQYGIQALPLSTANEPAFVPQSSQVADQWSAENLSLEPLSAHSNEDVAQELAKVDEYLRNCAEDACGNGSSSSVASSAPASPCTLSSNASSVSSEDSSADDPDWTFEAASTACAPSTSRGRPARGARRASGKPYSRPNVEDKRSRKKEQNKNAATRYRQKKKQEIKLIIGEEQELAERNEKLHGQVKDLQREIGYLKNLMRDLFKVKGLIK